MKVDQTNLLESLQNNNVNRQGQGVQEFVKETKDSSFTGAFSMDIHKDGLTKAGEIKGHELVYGKPVQGNEKSTVLDQLESQSVIDTKTRRDQMTVLSNTVSPEDYKKMQEDGFALSSTDAATMTTVIDKIKVNMAKTGADVDLSDLDEKQISEIAGSEAMAKEIVRSLEQADLPATEANVKETEDALNQLNSLEGVSDDTISYLLKNGLSDSVENLYLAEHSASVMSTVSKEEAGKLYQELEGEITGLLQEAGLEEDKENVVEAKWLLANDIPLTVENLNKLKELEKIGIALQEDGGIDFGSAMSVITKTIAAGKRPGQTSVSAITLQRQREETRLKMTAEANLTNEKKGMDTLDLSPIEESVEALKEEESSYYAELLKGKLNKSDFDKAELLDISQKASLMQDTEEALKSMKTAPAAVITELSINEEGHVPETLNQIKEIATSLTDTMKKAGESYEALMTAPRKDMGDSITKAFRNVDDILKDLELPVNETNRRAVRILAYNETELTIENIEETKIKDEEMQRTFKSLTPAVTLEMIRRGINPLEKSLSEVNQIATEIAEEIGSEDERFNKFLWKLEQKHEITKEERESFIGIYRLITQIEKNDGAALGSLMNQGGDMTMKNLLTATRNRQKRGMEYEIDDLFAGVNSMEKGQKIDNQIGTAFRYQKHCLSDVKEEMNPSVAAHIASLDWENMTPEELKTSVLDFVETSKEGLEKKEIKNIELAQEEANLETDYAKSELSSFGKVIETSEEVYQLLAHFDLPNTPINLLATSEMMRTPNSMFDTLFNKKREGKTSIELVRDLKDQVLEEFGEALEHPEELAEAENTLAKVAENVMKTMIIDEENISTLDIRELQKMCSQFTLAAKRAEEECFVIPIETGDGVGAVNLKIVRSSGEKGLVDILFQSEIMGKIAASFQAKEDHVSGMIAVDSKDSRQILSDHMGMIAQIFQEDTGEAIDLTVAYLPDMDYEKALRKQYQVKTGDDVIPEKGTDQYQVQTSRLYHIAESFIQTLQELTDQGSIF